MFGSLMMSAKQTTYSITNSIRANGSSAYLQKTLTTNTTTSGSVWIKRGKIGVTQPIFDNKIYFNSSDQLVAFGLTNTSAQPCRDPEAWMHIFWNGSGVWINGSAVTGSGSYTPASVTNPRLGYDGTNYFDGYFSDFAFWNGSSVSIQGGASSGGYWIPRRTSPNYSLCEFKNSGSLGLDTSGNANNWTVNGFSSSDQMIDTPSNNYCTINPLDWANANTATISSGNLKFVGDNGSGNVYKSTIAIPTGKWYFRARFDSIANSAVFTGLHNNTSPFYVLSYLGRNDSNGWGFGNAGYYNGANLVNWSFGSFGANDYIDVAFDISAGKIWIGKNGTWQASGNPDAGTSPYFSNLTTSGPIYICASAYVDSMTMDFQTSAPANSTTFKTVCTNNLTSTAVSTSGTFTGNASADGIVGWANGDLASLTINGNAVTWGTHADKLAGGFKLRTSSSSYNSSGSNTWTATVGNRFVSTSGIPNNAKGNS